MKTLIAVCILMVAACFAQSNDGSLKYDFGGAISGYFLPGIGQCGALPECGIVFNTIAGKFWNGKLLVHDDPMYTEERAWNFLLSPDFRGPHNVHFQTGPLLSGNYADGAEFGPGGQFHMITGDAPFLFCTADIPCTFDAHWVSAKITRAELSNGAHIYRFEGELLGAYFDRAVGKLTKITAHYHQDAGEWYNLLAPPDSQQWWTSGGLDIFPAGPQGQQ